MAGSNNDQAAGETARVIRVHSCNLRYTDNGESVSEQGMRKTIIKIVGGVLLFSVSSVIAQWNNPHPDANDNNVHYSSFAGPPKTLDPAKAYSSNELQFIAQIYEPLLQYHYLKRPYTLEPLTAVKMPTVLYYNKDWQPLPKDVATKDVAYSVYDIHIKPGIAFEKSPAFAKNKEGGYRYHHLSPSQLQQIDDINNFSQWESRELIAADYAYEIKRIAAPWVHSPIYGLMSEHILGLSDLSQHLEKIEKQQGDNNHFIDLRQDTFPGVHVLGRYHFQVVIKGVYPQFLYWLAMPFFAPVAWEVDAFYSQPELQERNISLDWHPVGTGPYQLVENNPNQRMVLQRNPLFHGETYPAIGEATDHPDVLNDAGLQMPFVDRFEFHLEKESIPRWNKFLQGYYDKSGISVDSFDQAVQLDEQGQPVLTPSMQGHDIRLQTTVSPSVYYIGFNMMDDLIGGDSEHARLLRQAISIAVDYEEYIAIFMNGRGVAANSPIPPGIFGYTEGQDGINDAVYFWDGSKKQRKPIDEAKRLLTKAGYPGGIDPKTHKALVINYDVSTGGGPDDKARFNWMRKQLKKIGIQLNIRSTQYNRFREKVRTGNAQMFSWGWLADYPDPENFIFLLYGPNGKVKHGGENASNYANPKFDRLFEEVVNMPDSPQRQQKIDEILAIVQHDSPWIWGVHPIDFTLSHSWNRTSKANAMANNVLKYERINSSERLLKRQQWNKPFLWPIFALLGLLLLLVLPLIIGYWRRGQKPVVKRNQEE